MFDVNKYFLKYRELLGGAVWQAKRIECADGFSVSVQAGAYHYCTPRNNEGPYTHVEAGFPSEAEPLLMEWAEEPDNPTGTVYGWVPAIVISSVVEKHGGLKGSNDGNE